MERMTLGRTGLQVRRLGLGGIPIHLTEEEKKEIEEIQNLYEKVFCRRCDYCQPCSEEVPIQTVLNIRSVVKRLGKGVLEEGIQKEFIDKARNCTECGVCATRCPCELPIPDLIRETLQWVDEQIRSS